MNPSLAWLGPLLDPSGYSDEARGFLRALEAAGAAPVAVPMGSVGVDAGLAAADRDMLERQCRRQPRPPFVAVHHYVPGPQQPVVQDAANVARCMFETDSLPATWRDFLATRDRIWVPSQHNVETFERGGIPADKLRVLGGTLDFDLFAPGASPVALDVPEGSFVFLTNFDFSERKGWQALVRAWARAFAATDPVCLVLKTGSYWNDDSEVRERIDAFVREEIGGFSQLAPLRILTGTLPAAELPGLYAAADAYVLASRGEGWGRPYMEAMAMGLPTIASRFSGNLEFMNDGNSWLVDGELVPVPDDADLINDFYRGHRWFEPDVDELARALATIAGDPAAARAKAAGARDELIERFGPEATARRVLELACEELGIEAPIAPASAPAGAASRVSPELRAFAAQFPAERQPILDFMVRVADELEPGTRVLDVGAGEAPYRELFSHVDYRTSDWTNSVHEGARRVDYVGSAEDLPVPDEAFDAVIMTQVLEHVPDPVAVLSEQFRILRPGGKIYLTLPFAWELHEMPYDFYRYSSPGLEHVMRRAGFHDIEIEARNDCFSTVGQLLRNLVTAMGRAGDGLNSERELASERMVQLAEEVESFSHLDAQRIFPLGWAAYAVKPDATTARAACELSDARGAAVLAFADELIERPELLRAYGSAIGASDDATLVIYSPGADASALEPALLAAVAAAGLDGDESPDMLAMPLGASVPDERLLATAVQAVLSAVPPSEGPLAALPAFGAADVDALKAHASASSGAAV